MLQDCTVEVKRGRFVLLGTVTRSLVATMRDDAIGPATLLEVCVGEATVVALDLVNAHAGQQVLVLTGHAADRRMGQSGKSGDAVVVAIVDQAACAAALP